MSGMEDQLNKFPFVEIKVRVEQNNLLVVLPNEREILSNAVLNGGLFKGKSILNHGAPDYPEAYKEIVAEPKCYLANLATSFGLSKTVATMTAVSMKDLVIEKQSYQDGSLCLLITGGVTNAVRAGDPTEWREAEGVFHQLGTINIILLTDICLTGRSLVDCIQVITEGKAAALQELAVNSTVSPGLATGTGTDTVIVVSGQNASITYGGTHSLFGEILGQLTIRGVKRAITKNLARKD